MYNIKKSPKEIFILFRGKFLEDIVKITLKKSKKGAIMAKGQWYLPYHHPEHEVSYQTTPHIRRFDYNIFMNF